MGISGGIVSVSSGVSNWEDLQDKPFEEQSVDIFNGTVTFTYADGDSDVVITPTEQLIENSFYDITIGGYHMRKTALDDRGIGIASDDHLLQVFNSGEGDIGITIQEEDVGTILVTIKKVSITKMSSDFIPLNSSGVDSNGYIILNELKFIDSFGYKYIVKINEETGELYTSSEVE